MSKFKNCFAFDLGSSHIRIFHEGKQKIEVRSEIIQDGKKYDGLIRKGVIAEFNACDIILRENLKKIQKPFLGFITKQFSSIVSVSSDNSDVSLRAYRDLMEHAGSREVYMINDCYLTAIGLGIKIEDNTFTIVDFGAGKTSITTVENKKIVKNEILDISFSSLIEQLQTYLSKNYKLIISKNTAEQLIIENSNTKAAFERTLRIEGLKKSSKESATISIKSTEIGDCLKNELDMLIERIVRHVENLEANTQNKTTQNGIYISGGASKLNVLKEELSNKVNISSKSYSSPESYLRQGIEIVLRNPSQYTEFMIR